MTQDDKQPNRMDAIAAVRALADRIEGLNPRLMKTQEVKRIFDSVATQLRVLANCEESRVKAFEELRQMLANGEAARLSLKKQIDEFRVKLAEQQPAK
jgi:hypothetical protein